MSARTALHKIFVYGTLKTGQPNHYVLKGPGVAQLVGAAKLAKRYPLVVATRYGIPGLLAREGSGQVSWRLVEHDSRLTTAHLSHG